MKAFYIISRRDIGQDAHTVDGNRWIPLTAELLGLQNEIGWRLFVDGCISIEWKHIIQKHFESVNSTNTGLCWVSSLIKKLYDTAWDMWNHRIKFLHETSPDEYLLGITKLNYSITRLHQQGALPLKKAWVDKVEAAIVLHKERDRSSMQQSRRLFRAWSHRILKMTFFYLFLLN